MKHLVGCGFVLALTLSAGVADATTMVFVHGRNAGTPTTTEACEYWGNCDCASGNNSAGYSNSGWCGFAGGSTGTYARYVARYDANRAWWGDGSTADPICDVALEINALSDTSVRVVGHSAGGLVTLGLLTDAANGWGSACGSGVVAGAANKITAVAAVQSPFSGARAADSVYGHLSTDWLHNLCGNTIGAIANIFADQATDMTYELQTSSMANNRSWVTNSNGKPVYIAFGTSSAGDDSGWLGAGALCTGGNYNDGLVEAWSARACTNNDAGKTGTCSSKPTNFTDYARGAIGHSSGRRGTASTSSDIWWLNVSTTHAHGMSDLVWNHSPI